MISRMSEYSSALFLSEQTYYKPRRGRRLLRFFLYMSRYAAVGNRLLLIKENELVISASIADAFVLWAYHYEARFASTARRRNGAKILLCALLLSIVYLAARTEVWRGEL